MLLDLGVGAVVVPDWSDRIYGDRYTDHSDLSDLPQVRPVFNHVSTSLSNSFHDFHMGYDARYTPAIYAREFEEPVDTSHYCGLMPVKEVQPMGGGLYLTEFPSRAEPGDFSSFTLQSLGHTPTGQVLPVQSWASQPNPPEMLGGPNFLPLVIVPETFVYKVMGGALQPVNLGNALENDVDPNPGGFLFISFIFSADYIPSISSSKLVNLHVTVADSTPNDADGAKIVITDSFGSAYITVFGNGNEYFYDPNNIFIGLGSSDILDIHIIYKIMDNYGLSATTTQDILIQGVNDCPILDAQASTLSVSVDDDMPSQASGQIIFHDPDVGEVDWINSIMLDGNPGTTKTLALGESADITIEYGTLHINSDGTYSFTVNANAELLTQPTTFKFDFTFGDPGAPEESCPGGQILVTINGDDLCQITFEHQILDPYPIQDDFGKGLAGNLIVDSGAMDSDGDPVHVGLVTFDAATSSPGITAGVPDFSTPGHEIIKIYFGADQVGALDVILSTGAYAYSNTVNAEKLPEGANVIQFLIDLNDGSGSDDCTAQVTLNITVTGDDQCQIILESSVLNPAAIEDEFDSFTSGNIVVDSGAIDSDGDPVHVGLVTFDTATSSAGITAGIPDFSTPDHEIIKIYFGADQVGTLDITLSSGAYTYTNTTKAEKLPEGSNVMEFLVNLNDGSGSDDCTAQVILNITVTGDDQCQITLESSVLNPAAIEDEFDSFTSGNIVVDSGAVDSDGDPVHVGLVTFDAATSSAGITAGVPDFSTPDHEIIKIYFGADQVGTLDVTLSTGAYTYSNTADAEKLPEGSNVIEFLIDLNDGSGSDDCTAQVTLNITVTGDDQCQITLESSVLNPAAIEDEFDSFTSGNIVVDSGAVDSDGDPVHVGLVTFDAANSSAGITAGAPDFSIPDHEIIKIYFGADQVGTLDITLSSGAYTYTNTTKAEKLPEGSNVMEFLVNLNDGSGSDDCTAQVILNITVTGDDQCQITLESSVLNPAAIEDEFDSFTNGNIVVDSGAVDSDGDPVHVALVTFDAANSSAGITAGAPNYSIPGREIIAIFYGGHQIGSLDVILATGAYTYTNTIYAEILPLGATHIEFLVDLNDGSGSDDCSAQVTLDLTIVGDEPHLDIRDGFGANSGDSTIYGTLVSFDEPLAMTLSGTVPTGLTSGGVAVTYTQVNAHEIDAYAGGNLVFTLDVNPDGTYVFHQDAPLDLSSLSLSGDAIAQRAKPESEYYFYDTGVFSSDGTLGNWVIDFSATSGGSAALVNPSAVGMGVGNNLIQSGEILHVEIDDEGNDPTHTADLIGAADVGFEFQAHSGQLEIQVVYTSGLVTTIIVPGNSGGGHESLTFHIPIDSAHPGSVIDYFNIIGDTNASARVEFVDLFSETGGAPTVLPFSFTATDDLGNPLGPSVSGSFDITIDPTNTLAAPDTQSALGGGPGGDMLTGGVGNDILTGNGGDDILTGGDGSDAFVFSFAGSFGHDTIIDFSNAQSDILQLTNTGGVSVGYLDTISHVQDDGAGHVLFVVDSGPATGATIEFTNIAFVAGLTHIDHYLAAANIHVS